MYLKYRAMRIDLNDAQGLIRHAFFLQSPVVCCTLSIWESEEAFVKFAGVPSHVDAVRYAKRYSIWSRLLAT